MTEADWDACADPTPMLEFLRGRASDRKLRLLACACCLLIDRWITDPSSRHAIRTAEQYADGLVSLKELSAARAAAPSSRVGDANPGGLRTSRAGLAQATSPFFQSGGSPHARDAARATASASAWVAVRDAQRRAMQQVWVKVGPSWETAPAKKAAEYRRQCAALRCVLGNPFRPVTLDLAWLAWNDGAVRKVAQAIYDDRSFDRLPLLADALEDAGCTDAAILAHCREPGYHVRGCWVVDLLLGKS